MKLQKNAKQWLLRKRLRKQCVFTGKLTLDKDVVCEGKNKLCVNSTILNVRLGFGSYIGDSSYIKNTRIGKYSCIARDVRTICGNHPTGDFASIHPSFYSTRKQSGFTYVKQNLFEDFKYLDKNKKISVIIGNDVWIGEGVRILEGISIGDGAIVAAGSIVTKDVDPYTIVAGIPSKKIRSRFNEEIIQKLLQIQWWNCNENWLKDHADLFLDVEKIIEFCSLKTEG